MGLIFSFIILKIILSFRVFMCFFFFGRNSFKMILQCAAFQRFNKCQTYLSECTIMFFMKNILQPFYPKIKGNYIFFQLIIFKR